MDQPPRDLSCSPQGLALREDNALLFLSDRASVHSRIPPPPHAPQLELPLPLPSLPGKPPGRAAWVISSPTLIGRVSVPEEELDAMLQEGKGPINFTVFLTLFGEKLNGEFASGLGLLSPRTNLTSLTPELHVRLSSAHLKLVCPWPTQRMLHLGAGGYQEYQREG